MKREYKQTKKPIFLSYSGTFFCPRLNQGQSKLQRSNRFWGEPRLRNDRLGRKKWVMIWKKVWNKVVRETLEFPSMKNIHLSSFTQKIFR